MWSIISANFLQANSHKVHLNFTFESILICSPENRKRGFHVYVSRKLLSNFVYPSLPFGIEGGVWDVIVLIPDHCLSIYFEKFYSHRPLEIAFYYHVSSM